MVDFKRSQFKIIVMNFPTWVKTHHHIFVTAFRLIYTHAVYKKHHPPALEDEVWRLEKIGKGGAFHTKLASHGVNTVQDFLKLYNVDASALRSILGVGMSEKMWEVTLKHAKTCVLGTTLYRYRANNYTLTLNPVCQLVNADFNGQLYHQFHLDGVMQKVLIKFYFFFILILINFILFIIYILCNCGVGRLILKGW